MTTAQYPEVPSETLVHCPNTISQLLARKQKIMQCSSALRGDGDEVGFGLGITAPWATDGQGDAVDSRCCIGVAGTAATIAAATVTEDPGADIIVAARQVGKVYG